MPLTGLVMPISPNAEAQLGGFSATTNPSEALGAADIVVERLDQLGVEAFQRLLDSA